MKRLAITILILACGAVVSAQIANPGIVAPGSSPSGGSCSAQLPLQVFSGTVYTCSGGVYTAISGGSGTFNALTGDATSTATGGATTVVGINGTLLSSLSTGLLKITTATGAASTVAAPTGAIVGTTDIQTLTNKSIAGSEINSGLVASTVGGTGVNNSATLTLGSSNQNWATLGTGIVKNTTTTGALSNATSADILAACATCVTSAASLTSNALMTGAGSQGSQTVTTGTGVVTALGVNTGSAGAFVVNGGALGTPSSGTGTNITGIPAANINSGALANGMTATTQSAGSNDTKLATDAYVDSSGLHTVVDSSTPVTVSSTLAAEQHFNENATAATAVTYNLPTAAAGKQFCFSNANNGSAANTGVLTIATSAAGQFIIFTDGTLSATGGNVTSGGAAADAACVSGIDSTHWMLYVQRGTWTKH